MLLSKIICSWQNQTQQMMKLERHFKLPMHGTSSKKKWIKGLTLTLVAAQVLYQVVKNKESQSHVLSFGSRVSYCWTKQLLPWTKQTRDWCKMLLTTTERQLEILLQSWLLTDCPQSKMLTRLSSSRMVLSLKWELMINSSRNSLMEHILASARNSSLLRRKQMSKMNLLKV